MKKTYINPDMEIVTLQMHKQLLSESNPTGEVNYDSDADPISPGSVESRRFGFDFDDEDDE